MFRDKKEGINKVVKPTKILSSIKEKNIRINAKELTKSLWPSGKHSVVSIKTESLVVFWPSLFLSFHPLLPAPN